MHSLGTAGTQFLGSENVTDWPAGCYSCSNMADCTDGVWFNAHATGAANGQARPLCGPALYMPPVSGKTLFIGDSDIDFWPNPSPFPGSYNVGSGGDSCTDVLGEVEGMLATFSPERVVLVCGENDLSSGRNVTQTFDTFSQIVTKLAAVPRVLYIGTKPEPATTSLHSSYREYDALIKQYAATLALSSGSNLTPLVMVDSYSSLEDLGNGAALYDTDQLHLSATGYGHWSQWATQALNDTDAVSQSCEVWRSGACVQPVSSFCIQCGRRELLFGAPVNVMPCC